MRKTIIGSGIYNLDVIVVREYPSWPERRPFVDRTVLQEVGGTCGNVMAILARLGWDARPQVSLDDSPEGRRIAEDLRRYGCDCRYVTTAPGGGTTILWCNHRKDPDGNPVMGFRTGSPGGSRFPRRRFLRARDEAPAFVEALEEVPLVYFFDDPAAGHRHLARALRERGSVVYFEPSGGITPQKLEAASLSDIVKVSAENCPDADVYGDVPLLIQTLGGEGVRFRLRGGDWMVLPPAACNSVVDTEGAGDWTTAVFLDELFREGFPGMEGLGQGMVSGALAAAQKMAARSIGYLSPKGMISGLAGECVNL